MHFFRNRFKESFTNCKSTFDSWLNQNRSTFRDPSHDQQVNFIGTLVTFNEPKNLADFRKWTTCGTVASNNYPKSFYISIPGANGFDRFPVCAVFFRYVFAIGHKRFRTLMTDLWQCRSNANIVCKWRQNYKSYRDKEDEPAWISQRETFVLTHMNVCDTLYKRQRDSIFELNAGAGKLGAHAQSSTHTAFS